MNHTAKMARYMSVPAEGYYVDCRCGRRGGVRLKLEDAQADHEAHVAEEAARHQKIEAAVLLFRDWMRAGSRRTGKAQEALTEAVRELNGEERDAYRKEVVRRFSPRG